MALPVVLCSALLAAGAAAGEDARARGDAIAAEADSRNAGFVDQQARLVMTLVNARGDRSVRELDIRTLEGTDEGDRIMTVFVAPADLRRTAFLTHTHKHRPDEQWLYLPATRREKRISSANRSSPFFGSEFSYEDLASIELEKYRHRHIGTESIDGIDCHVIERIPLEADSAYGRLVVWIDREHLQTRRIEYHDRDDRLLKTLTANDYALHDGRFWRAGSLRMINHRTDKQTLLEWRDYRFGTGLDSSDFSARRLSRAGTP